MKPAVGFLDGLIGRNSPGKAGCITRPASSGMSGFIWFHVIGKVDCRFFLARCFLDGLGWKIPSSPRLYRNQIFESFFVFTESMVEIVNGDVKGT
jgi:hypothetical protein